MGEINSRSNVCATRPVSNAFSSRSDETALKAQYDWLAKGDEMIDQKAR